MFYAVVVIASNPAVSHSILNKLNPVHNFIFFWFKFHTLFPILCLHSVIFCWYFLFEIFYAFLFCSVHGCMPTSCHCPWSDQFKYNMDNRMCLEVHCPHHCTLWPIL